jgi:hypothetical protein
VERLRNAVLKKVKLRAGNMQRGSLLEEEEEDQELIKEVKDGITFDYSGKIIQIKSLIAANLGPARKDLLSNSNYILPEILDP